jgi:hypothetical protein
VPIASERQKYLTKNIIVVGCRVAYGKDDSAEGPAMEHEGMENQAVFFGLTFSVFVADEDWKVSLKACLANLLEKTGSLTIY